MMEIEKYTPQENFILGLLFTEGYFLARLIRRVQTNYEAYQWNSGTKIAADGVSTNWETPTDSEGRYYLEPQKKEHIYQIFTGISPSSARLFWSYPKRVDRGSIIAERSVPSAGDSENIGFWSGEMSPYRDPSPITQLFTVEDLYPYFKANNHGISGVSRVIKSNFIINIYTYQVIKDQTVQDKIIKGEKRATIYTMGDPEQTINAPQWLKDQYGKNIRDPEKVTL